MNNRILKNVIERLDKIAGILGVFAGFLVISVSYVLNIDQFGIGIVIFTSSLFYLLIRSKIRDSVETLILSYQKKQILNVIFYGIFLITLFLYASNSQDYNRSFEYILLVSVLVGLIAIEILIFKEGDREFPILFKIMLLSLNIRASIFYLYPSIMGYDAYSHARIADSITSSGFVPPVEMIGKYASYSSLHILLSVTELICRVDIKNAIMFSIGLTSIICGTLFLFVIGKKIAGPQVGLLSALLLNVTSYTIIRGIANITPGSLVFCYMLICLYLIFESNQTVGNKILLLGIMFLMIMTHQLSTFVSFLCIAFIFVGICIYNMLYKPGQSPFTDIDFNYVILFAVTLQAYWMYTYVGSGLTFFEMVVNPLLSVLKSGGEYGGNILISGYDYQRSSMEEIILQACYLILPFFVIGGIYSWLSSKKSSKFSIAFAIILLYILIYGLPSLGMRNFLTSRWFPFASILLVLITSAYIFDILSLFRSYNKKAIVLFSIVFIFSLLMIITPAINKDTPVVEKDRSVRNQFKDSEILAVKTIVSSYNGSIILDSPLNYCANFYKNSSQGEFQIFKSDFIESNVTAEDDSIVILRKSTLKEPVSIQYSNLFGLVKNEVLNETFFAKFESSDYNFVYDNGDVMAYSVK